MVLVHHSCAGNQALQQQLHHRCVVKALLHLLCYVNLQSQLPCNLVIHWI
jgi:hypothetical protein